MCGSSSKAFMLSAAVLERVGIIKVNYLHTKHNGFPKVTYVAKKRHKGFTNLDIYIKSTTGEPIYKR